MRQTWVATILNVDFLFDWLLSSIFFWKNKEYWKEIVFTFYLSANLYLIFESKYTLRCSWTDLRKFKLSSKTFIALIELTIV